MIQRLDSVPEVEMRIADGILEIRTSASIAAYLAHGLQSKIRLLSHSDPSPDAFEATFRCARIGTDLCDGACASLSREDAEAVGSCPRSSMNSEASSLASRIAKIAPLLIRDGGIPIRQMDRTRKAIAVVSDC